MNHLDIEHIFASSHDIHCVMKGDIIERANPRLGVLLGVESSELIGSSLLSLTHEEDVPTWKARTRDQLCCVRCRHVDGSWRWIEWSITPLAEGQCYIVGRDVTHRMREQLESALHLTLLEESMKLFKAGYYNVDVPKEKVFWSEQIYIIHGVDPKEPTPPLDEAIDFYHPDDRAKVSAHVARAIEHSLPFDFQLRLIRASDNQERLVHSRGFPKANEFGEMTELFGIFRDLTDDPHTVRQQELEHFAYITSHDLREPLRILRMYLSLLATAHDDFPEAPSSSYWSRIQRSAERMDALIEDLSLYATAGQRAELSPTSLSAVIRDAIAQVSAEHALDGIELHIAPALPMVFGDRKRLQRAFVQLLENAIKFSATKEGVSEVSVEWLEVGSHIEVIISDNGPGFEPRFADRIFLPFTRLASSDQDGTGMGLSIVQRIIQQCDGRVWAKSEPGEGASFHVLLLKALPTD